MKLVLLFFTVLSTLVVSGQTKIEIEKRISQDSVPNKAKIYISEQFKASNIKWFFEKTNARSSYEAKFCELNKRFSVEFSIDGTLEDIEVLIKFKKLAPETKKIITTLLNSKFTNYRVLKTQFQQSDYDKTKLELFLKTKTLSELDLLELIVLGKTENSKNRYEILINSKGEVLSMLQLKEQSQTFLQF
tara:strand:- start:931 stop:1497 length:567 start_codon:yes stop_codon:yes gene_type:complete